MNSLIILWEYDGRQEPVVDYKRAIKDYQEYDEDYEPETEEEEKICGAQHRTEEWIDHLLTDEEACELKKYLQEVFDKDCDLEEVKLPLDRTFGQQDTAFINLFDYGYILLSEEKNYNLSFPVAGVLIPKSKILYNSPDITDLLGKNKPARVKMASMTQ